jgi:hypothetical protein
LTDQKEELPMAAMFVNEWDEMNKIYRGPSIDTSYQDLVHLAKLFQRKANRRQMPSDGKSSHGLWTGELKYD